MTDLTRPAPDPDPDPDHYLTKLAKAINRDLANPVVATWEPGADGLPQYALAYLDRPDAEMCSLLVPGSGITPRLAALVAEGDMAAAVAMVTEHVKAQIARDNIAYAAGAEEHGWVPRGDKAAQRRTVAGLLPEPTTTKAVTIHVRRGNLTDAGILDIVYPGGRVAGMVHADAVNVPTVDPGPDWTSDPDGKSNSSVAYGQLVGVVETIIRDSAFSLIGGRADHVAALIVAQLAHVHGMRPGGATEVKA